MGATRARGVKDVDPTVTAGSFLAPRGRQLLFSKCSRDVDRILTELGAMLAARVNDGFEHAVTCGQIDRDPVKGRIDRVSSNGTASDALHGKLRAFNRWFCNYHRLSDTVGKLYLVDQHSDESVSSAPKHSRVMVAAGG